MAKATPSQPTMPRLSQAVEGSSIVCVCRLSSGHGPRRVAARPPIVSFGSPKGVLEEFLTDLQANGRILNAGGFEMRSSEPEASEIDVDAAAVQYAGLVNSVLHGFRLCEADRHDIAQTVWLRLVEKAHALRDPRCLPGWLRTTARNEAISHLRRVARCSPGFIDDQADPRLGPEDQVILAEERRTMAESFDSLPEPDRELISMTVLDDAASYVQISQRLGRPPGSIGPSRQRALSRLKQKYSSAGSPYLR